jgi:hypothetical protein
MDGEGKLLDINSMNKDSSEQISIPSTQEIFANIDEVMQLTQMSVAFSSQESRTSEQNLTDSAGDVNVNCTISSSDGSAITPLASVSQSCPFPSELNSTNKAVTCESTENNYSECVDRLVCEDLRTQEQHLSTITADLESNCKDSTKSLESSDAPESTQTPKSIEHPELTLCVKPTTESTDHGADDSKATGSSGHVETVNIVKAVEITDSFQPTKVSDSTVSLTEPPCKRKKVDQMSVVCSPERCGHDDSATSDQKMDVLKSRLEVY